MAKPKSPRKKDNTTIFRKYTRAMWVTAISGMLVLMSLFVFVSATKIPDTEELEKPDYELSSTVYSEDMQELGKYFRYNRDWVTFDDLNKHLVDALVATEDERFFSHCGIDLKGTARAMVFLGSKGGASTITQQLAKLFYTPKRSNFVKRVWQKMKEWVIAVEFERRYTKEEIIAMYLNKYDFLYNSNGVSAAAKTYFGKDQKDLTVEEAAVLIGMLKNPFLYNPILRPENAAKRRSVVMYQMVKNDYLSREEYDKLKGLPLDVSNFRKTIHHDGPAPYFREEMKKYLKEILSQDRYKKPDGTAYNIYEDGLKIYTTIDMKMQRHAEESMAEHMKQLQERYENRWKNKDPWEYRLDKKKKALGKKVLTGLIEDTPRYGSLRNKYLSEISRKIESKIEKVRLWDTDMWRMMKEDEKPGSLADRVKRKEISKERSATYKKIMASEDWETLKSQWQQFRKAVKEDFNKKRKMKVFAYNGTGEKTVTMSPLDSIKYHRRHMQFGSMSMEPQTGYVKTWVGGINYKYFQYDHIRSRRQVGSTFKPFVYTTAISAFGMSPCHKIKDQQYSIPAGGSNFGLMKPWAPSNSNGKFSGEDMTIKDALRSSTNSVAVSLMIDLGNVEPIRELASNCGIDKNSIPKAPSICLGTPELSVMEMVGAYSTFANNGVYIKPVFIKKIEDKNGKIIYSAVPEQKKAIIPKYNYVMLEMLKHAAESISSKFDSEMGGKTGTTNDYVDGWYMGVTPSLVVGTWVGGEDQFIRFRNLADGQGGVMARPFYEKFMKKLENDPKIAFDKNAKFPIPEGDMVELDCDIYAAMIEQDNNSVIREEEFEEEF